MSASGGCQCGAVRFRAGRTGEAIVCHCRMCQKATGSPFAVTIDVYDLIWTRGTPGYFQSSNRARRSFCAACGTPLTYEAGHYVNMMIGAFDNPAPHVPTVQIAVESKLPWSEDLCSLPRRSPKKEAEMQMLYAATISNQHPDED